MNVRRPAMLAVSSAHAERSVYVGRTAIVVGLTLACLLMYGIASSQAADPLAKKPVPTKPAPGIASPYKNSGTPAASNVKAPSDAKAPAAAAEDTATQADLEQRFAEEMSGATLVGQFTLGGQAGSKTERYTISKVGKLAGDIWLFEARIVYENHDLTVPLPLAVKWAGDTPVITLTDMTLPGLGTYTARVLIYRGQYAGTWSAGDHGGQLFGRIERAAADEKADAESEK